MGPNIQELTLSHNSMGTPAATALARSRHFSHLTDLDLSVCSIGDEGATALAAHSLSLYGQVSSAATKE